MDPWRSEVTSAGLDTFGGPLTPAPAPGRTHRRVVTVLALGVLAVAGAAGSYLAVLSGLGTLLSAKPAAPQQQPPAAAERRDAAATSALGRGRARQVVPAAPVAPSTVLVLPAPTARATTRPPRPVPSAVPPSPLTPGAPDCADCMTPPVPTPTAPPSSPASPSPSGEPSGEPSRDPSAEPSPSDAAPTPPESPEPSDLADPPPPNDDLQPSAEGHKSGHSRHPRR